MFGQLRWILISPVKKSINFMKFSSSRLVEEFNVVGTLISDGPIKGSFAEVRHKFEMNDLHLFAKITGDINPIHFDEHYAQSVGMFKGVVVHGLLVSSLFPTLFGKVIPGSVYAKQSLKFKNPIYVSEYVVARMEIIDSIPFRRRGLLMMIIFD